MWHSVTNKVKKDKFTYSSTPFSRLHLSGCWGRHGAERGAHIPERRWNGEVWSISAVLQRYSQTWTTLEEGNTSGPNDLPILICALLLHFNSFIQLAVRGAKIVIPLHFDSCAVVPSVRQLCEPNSLLPRFARSASVWSAQLSHGVISTVLSGNRGGDRRQISQSQSCLGFERQQLAQARLRALWGLGES